MYKIVLGQAKPGHTICQAKGSGKMMGVKAGNQDQLKGDQQLILILYT